MTPTGAYALETSGLTKTFGSHDAVADLSLQVPHGSVFGFLGPNGSGKTTTIRMLLGLASPTSGQVSLLGHPIPGELDVALPKVGALVEGPAFYPYLSGHKNLLRFDAADRFSDSSTRAERVASALARVGLSNASDKKAGEYSLGMKQRLGLANALLKPRELLILDEPTNGLDPQGTREVRNLIRSLASEGITIFLSSHLLGEIEQVCSHVAVMSEGALVAHGSLEELRQGTSARLVLEVNLVTAAKKVLKTWGITPTTATRVGSTTRLVAPVESSLDVGAVNTALVSAGVTVSSLLIEQPTLEEYFVGLTGEGFDVAR
ncbi:MAG: ATP-binding cassette domain-containing protein [Actinomycetota bacterium]|nr:ATP-binding cassette domain-containing protein [Actinomycetota bacterium]MDA2980821.1 ATP-binding cassette domain-containing protein [Actinomycetota bacterium]MDA3003313.1 ATP-binding cassette domain-containing protein [Actinomycetota bacterium]